MSGATVYFWQGPFADFRYVEDQPKILQTLRRMAALTRVESLLRRPPGLRSQVHPEVPRPEAAKDGYRLANRVRALLGNEADLIEDPRALLEDHFDVLVLAEPLATSRIHALTLKDNVSEAVAVVVNSAGERFGNPQAIRVDLLHELAHVLFDPPNGDVNLVVDDLDDANPRKLVEQRARAFAAELLMPAEGLRRLLGKPSYVLSIETGLALVERARSAFDTPVEITVNHLVNREYIVDWNRDTLIARGRLEFERAPARRPLFAEDRPNLLERRLAQAAGEELIDPEEARRLLAGKVEPAPQAPLTVAEALARLRSFGLQAEAVEGPDIHILGGAAVSTEGGIRAYTDGFAILSEPGLGFTVLLSGRGQADESHTFSGLGAAVAAVIGHASSGGEGAPAAPASRER